MKLDRTRNTVLALAVLSALAAGCSDSDKTKVKNEFGGDDGGTTTRDTIDLNLGTDAEVTALGLGESDVLFLNGEESGRLDNSIGAFPAGNDGSVVAHFRQDARIEVDGGDEDFEAYNFFRVLEGEPGTDGDVDDHARVPYAGDFTVYAQSPSKRFWALARSSRNETPKLHEDEEDTPPTFSVVCYDSDAQRYSRELDVVEIIEDDTVFSSSPESGSPSIEQVLVDNTGLVTLFFTACPPINFGEDDEEDPNAIYVVQADARSGRIVRQPQVVSSRYNIPREDNNEVSFEGAAIAANGDIAMAYVKDDDDEGISFETVYYSRSLDEFGEGQSVVDIDVNSINNINFIFSDLDTDGRHFQVVVGFQDSSSADHMIVSRRVDTAELRERIAASDAEVPADELDDAFGEDTTLARTGDGGDVEPFGVSFDGPLQINFGRNGTSIVHWVHDDENSVRCWAAAATSDAGGQAGLIAGPVLLAAVAADSSGVDVSPDNGNVRFDMTPRYAFTDDDKAVIAFGLSFDEFDDNIDEELPQLYAATFNRATQSFATPSVFEPLNRDEIANFAANVQDSDENFSSSSITVEASLSGFSRGSTAAEQSCVLAWHSSYEGEENIAHEHHVAARLFHGISAGEEGTLYLERSSQFEIDQFHLASTNDVKTSASYPFQLDSSVDPDSLPARGTSNVWIAWRQFTPHPDASQSQTGNDDEEIPTTGLLRGFFYDFNGARHERLVGEPYEARPIGSPTSNVNENAVRVEFGDIHSDVDGIEGVWPHPSGSGTTVFARQDGTTFQFDWSPSGSESSPASVDERGRIAPEDLLAHDQGSEDARRAHIDGMGFGFSTNGDGTLRTSFHGGERIWSIFQGSDELSQRVFGKRTR